MNRATLQRDLDAAIARVLAQMTQDADNVLALAMYRADEKRARRRIAALSPEEKAPQRERTTA
jgi:hypothetical protein